MVYMAEILVTLSVLREPARIFLNKMCSFDVTDFEKTLLVTLYFFGHFVKTRGEKKSSKLSKILQ